MAVVKVIELISSSPESFDEAIKAGLERANKTIRNVKGIDIVGQNLVIEKGKVAEYRVVMKVAFVVED